MANSWDDVIDPLMKTNNNAGTTAPPQTPEATQAQNKGSAVGGPAPITTLPEAPTKSYTSSPQYVAPNPAGSTPAATTGHGEPSDTYRQGTTPAAPTITGALTDPTGQGTQYMNAQGQPYSASDLSSGQPAYWQTADGKWWMGTSGGAISSVYKAPWETIAGSTYRSSVPGLPMNTTTTTSQSTYNQGGGGSSTTPSTGLNNAKIQQLVDAMSSMPYDEDYVNLMAGNLREDLQNAGATQRGELANRLSASGIEGGMAQNELGGVDRSIAQGMSSGLADIYQTGMETAYEDRRKALEALLEQEGLGVQKYGIDVNAQVSRESIAQQASNAQLQYALGLKQLDLQQLLGQGELDYKTKALALEEYKATTDMQLALEQLSTGAAFQNTQLQTNTALTLLQYAMYADSAEKELYTKWAMELLGGD